MFQSSNIIDQKNIFVTKISSSKLPTVCMGDDIEPQADLLPVSVFEHSKSVKSQILMLKSAEHEAEKNKSMANNGAQYGSYTSLVQNMAATCAEEGSHLCR